MTLRAGDLAFIDKTLIQIREILPETNQVLAYSIFESKFVLVDFNKVSNRVELEQQSEFVEDVLLLSSDGNRSELAKRIKTGEIRLNDGTVIKAPTERIVIDGSKMLTADIIVYLLAQDFIPDELDFLGTMARLNKAYHQVINSDKIWKFMLTKHYNQFYLHYLDAETEELHSTVKTVLDTFTREPKKRGQRYYKRFYEFIMKIRHAKKIVKKPDGQIQGIGPYKYLNAVFQCGDSVFILMGLKEKKNTGNVLMRIPHSFDIFAMLTQGPLNVIYQNENPFTLDTYDQNGFVFSEGRLNVWYYSVSHESINVLYSQYVVPFKDIWKNLSHVSILNKKSVAISIVDAFDRIFNTYIYSRKDFSLQGNLIDVHVIRAKNTVTFYAMDLTKTYLHSYGDIEEWSPNTFYPKYSGVFYKGNLYISLSDNALFDPEKWYFVNEQYVDKIVKDSKKYRRGGWVVPFIEINTNENMIRTQLNLNFFNVLEDFFSNFNEMRDDVIPFKWFRETIPHQISLLRSPVYCGDGYLTSPNSIDFGNGRGPRFVELHPIFDSNGLIHEYNTKGEQITISPGPSKTNLVSCSACSEPVQFKCSNCEESYCGESCFQGHALFC